MPSICAVIVTFNRKHLLANCIRSIYSGSLVPDETLVVDNASSDGTPEFLRENFPEVSILRLARNSGGAGGFKAGMSAATGKGHDVIWVMDDDHVVEPTTLQVMFDTMMRTGSDIVGPVVMSTARDGSLSWAMGPGGQGYIEYASMVRDYAATGTIPQIPAPFNAVLYRRQVLDVLGLPDERLFIRGDEIEYAYRMEYRHVKSVVAIKALVYHPPIITQSFCVLHIGKWRLGAPYTADPLKDYCLSRNRAFYFKKYRIYKSLLLEVVRFPIFFLITRRLDFRGFSLWIRGYFHGLAGHFGYERRFLAF